MIDLSIQFAPQTISTGIVLRSGCRVRRSSRHDASVRDENDDENRVKEYLGLRKIEANGEVSEDEELRGDGRTSH